MTGDGGSGDSIAVSQYSAQSHKHPLLSPVPSPLPGLDWWFLHNTDTGSRQMECLFCCHTAHTTLQLIRVYNAVILTGGGGEWFSNCGSRVLNWLESNSYRALLVKYFYDYWVPNSGRVIYGLEWKDEIFGWVNINKKKYLKSFTQSVTSYKFYNWLSI